MSNEELLGKREMGHGECEREAIVAGDFSGRPLGAIMKEKCTRVQP